MGCVSQAVFFRKEDEKLLRKLLKKVRGKPNPNGKELTRFTLTSHGACPVCMQVKLQADQTDEEAKKFSMQEATALASQDHRQVRRFREEHGQAHRVASPFVSLTRTTHPTATTKRS